MISMKYRSFITIISTLLVLFVGQSAFAQQQKPKWTEGFFVEGTNTYLQCIDASGYDHNDARTKAVNKIYENRNLAASTDVSVTITDNNVQVAGKKDLMVKARIIDEYHEVLNPGNHKVYLLVQTAKNPTFDFDQVQLTDKYKFTPRVFVPGMAQIHKGSLGKGIFFIASEAVFVGGIVVAESIRSNNINLINSTHDSQLIKSYTDKANTWASIRDISIAGAVVVYLWNVIDGIVAKGDQHIILSDAFINISPYTDIQSTGFALSIKF